MGTNNQKERYSYAEALEFSKIARALADVSLEDPDLHATVADLKERASHLIHHRHERRKLANKVGQAASAEARKKKTEERNKLMREAILELLGQGVVLPAKISKGLIAKGIKPPKATRWSATQLRNVAPEIPRQEIRFSR